MIETDIGAGRLLRGLLDQATVGMAIFDSDLRYVYVNQGLVEINGVAAEAHLGRTLEEVVPEIASAARRAFKRVLETGEPLLDWELSGETTAAPGEIRHWLENVYPLTENGTVAALGAVIVEVTDRKRAEERLLESERRFRSLVNAMDDIVFTLDRGHRHTGIWGSWLEREGIGRESFIGRTASEIFGPEQGAVHARQTARALRGEHVLYQWSAPDGRRFQTSLTPLATNGEVEGVVGVGREITELHEVQDQLATQRRRVSDLLARLESGLTPRMRSIPGWRTAWRYHSSDEEMLLGGDFLGVAPAGDGSIAFVIGDVAGRGPAAAGLGAALRAGWKALVGTGSEPAAILEGLDRLFAGYAEGAAFATVCCGRASAGGSVLEVASAGHHPPLRISGDEAVALELEIGPALGVTTGPRHWPRSAISLTGESAVLAVTDGAFEGRFATGERERLGYRRLAELIPVERVRAGELDAALDTILERIEARNGTGFDDDVAMLLLRPAS